ncbi:MerR family transcriptional regulator [Hahella sp. KA22]|nr:helix-turn-helix domain-containing protein [Hahella sp. KA22]AZZ95572.1 MerR family transcriptional regulator [Hahella sp. KA22]QAY58498.1 MerR family transcriptional regulator [Hahella sp. KA22]
MDIGEVVKLSGLPASTLRFYEEKQLIQPIGRNGLRRIYDAGILQRLALISLGRNAGFSLEEIAAMLTPKGVDIDRRRLIAKADEIDRQIQRLSVMRDGLRHAAECPAPSHLECPTFLRILNVVDKAQQKKIDKNGSQHSCAR